jgi:hypothetical protein
VRVVERLIGDEAVNIRCFDAGVVQTSFDAFKMQRMRARLRPLADFRFSDADGWRNDR